MPVADLSDAQIVAELDALNARQHGPEFRGRVRLMVDPQFAALVDRRADLLGERNRRVRADRDAIHAARLKADRDALTARTTVGPLVGDRRTVSFDGFKVGWVRRYRTGGWTCDGAAGQMWPTLRDAVYAVAYRAQVRADRRHEEVERWDAPAGTTPVTVSGLIAGDVVSLPPHTEEPVTVVGVDRFRNGGCMLRFRRPDGTLDVLLDATNGRGQIGRYPW